MDRRRHFYDYGPLVVFFVAYKLGGIYTATAALMISTVALSLGAYVLKDKLSTSQIGSMILVLIFGAMTLWFHDARFIQWKPTLLYGLLALLILYTLYFRPRCAMESLLGAQYPLAPQHWRRLSQSTVVYLIFLALTNLWMVAHYSMSTWVQYKVFGTVTLTLLYSVGCALYIQSHHDR